MREVAKDLIERGTIRRKHGQSIDAVIQHEAQTVIAEVSGDIRALTIELGIGAVIGGATLLESFVRQVANEAVSAGVHALVEAMTRSRKKT